MLGLERRSPPPLKDERMKKKDVRAPEKNGKMKDPTKICAGFFYKRFDSSCSVCMIWRDACTTIIVIV